ncbi:MAG TPA: hypothetical protein VGH91_15075 [Gammaproteobacteria bacterium]|jgi:hypothetical protein
MQDYNARQYFLMLEAIDSFYKKTITLSTLKNRINNLVGVLEDIDDHRKAAFLKQCGILEQVNATVIDKTFPAIPSQYINVIANATKQIRELVNEEIEKRGE